MDVDFEKNVSYELTVNTLLHVCLDIHINRWDSPSDCCSDGRRIRLQKQQSKNFPKHLPKSEIISTFAISNHVKVND